MSTNVDQIMATLQSLNKSSFSSDYDRSRVVLALFEATRRLQLPWEVVLDHAWQEPLTKAMIKTLIEADLWKKWVGDKEGKPQTSSELASLVGFEPALLKRILRLLAGQHLIEETGDGDTYELTDFSRGLGGPDLPFVYTYHAEFQNPLCAHLPKYLAARNYTTPTLPQESACADWLKGEDFFAYIAKKPSLGEAFNHSMAVYSAGKAAWTDGYPTETLIRDAKPNAPIFVDVAGGTGHDLENLRKLYPDVPAGSFILQDLPHVVDATTVQSPIEKQGMDLFKPNPVKGALAYYLHVVLHDWPDAKAIEILENIKPSLEKGYSKILIHEHVVLQKEAHPRIAVADLTMMMSFSAGERTEAMWRNVVEKAGLKVAKIHTSSTSPEAVIEVVLP